MIITDINHAKQDCDDEVSHLKVQGAGVIVTLIHRPGRGIDITVNPSGEDFSHNVKALDVALNSSQIRVSGAQGSPLG